MKEQYSTNVPRGRTTKNGYFMKIRGTEGEQAEHIFRLRIMDIKELMKRYDFKSSRGVRAFITRHLGEINADGEKHAKQTIEGWQFDETAVRIIDKLRGISSVAIVEREESEQIQELKSEVENLKNLLLMTQNKLLQKTGGIDRKSKTVNGGGEKIFACRKFFKS